MKKNSGLMRISKIAVPILKRNGVVKAGIFGSYARGDNKKSSDVDFLVQFKPGMSLLDMSRLRNQLMDSLARSVDLVEYSRVKPRIKDQILREEVKLL